MGERAVKTHLLALPPLTQRGRESTSPGMLSSGTVDNPYVRKNTRRGPRRCIPDGQNSLKAKALFQLQCPLSVLFSMELGQMASCPSVRGFLRKAKPLLFQIVLWNLWPRNPHHDDKERHHNCGKAADNYKSFLKRFNYLNCIKGDIVHLNLCYITNCCFCCFVLLKTH